eukprot:345026-Pelagomonas_calceolata.AAC.1
MVPATPVEMMCRVTSLSLGEGVGVWTKYQFKVNIPVLRSPCRDLGRINVSLFAWDRAHKDSIRTALVPGRGANTIREKPVWNEMLSGTQGVADLFVSKLTVWVVSFYVGHGDWGLPHFKVGCMAYQSPSSY